MNCDQDIWYDELYRIFSDDVLLSVYQVQKLGKAMRALQDGEDATPELNELYYSIKQFKDLAEILENYMHSYIKHQEEVNNDAKDSKESEYHYENDTPDDHYHY